jgi:hypothetical protein
MHFVLFGMKNRRFCPYSACQDECNEAPAFVLSGNEAVTHKLRMKADWRLPIGIGGVDCRLLKYTVLPRMSDAEYASRGRRGP